MGRELKRVPLDFNQPIEKIWTGYINPHDVSSKCSECENGDGMSPFARQLQNAWYGYAAFNPVAHGSKLFAYDTPAIRDFAKRNVGFYKAKGFTEEQALVYEGIRLANMFNSQWMHHLNQMEVDALHDSGQLMSLTHEYILGKGWVEKIPPVPVPTAEEINILTITKLPFFSPSLSIVMKHLMYRLGMPSDSSLCPHCKGEGYIWPSQDAKNTYDNWEKYEPPSGDGYQMWENTTEGSPISPVFATPEELAYWLTKNRKNSIDKNTTYEQWMNMICGNGWAPTMIMSGGTVMTGVEGISYVDDEDFLFREPPDHEYLF
jgi:hypothetical protein